MRVVLRDLAKGLWAVLIAGAVGAAFACGSESDVSGQGASGVSVTQEMEAVYNKYTDALQAGDVETVRSLLFDERVARVEAVASLGAFVERESGKLNEYLISHGGQGGTFKVESVSGAAPVRVAQLSYMGDTLPKEVYFIGGNGALKLDFQASDAMRALVGNGDGAEGQLAQALSTSTYKIGHHWAGCYPCSSASSYKIQAGGIFRTYSINRGEIQRRTGDDVCGSWFDGGRFTGLQRWCGRILNSPLYCFAQWTSTVKCDWNAWGEDFALNTLGEWRCNDPC